MPAVSRLLGLAGALVAFLFASPAGAQVPGAGLEPGEAEARQKERAAVQLPWTQPAVEARGIWVAARDLAGTRAEIGGKLDRLKAANLNTVLVDTLFRGYVAYPGSAVLPGFPEFKGEDVLGIWVEEAHRRGLRAEAWMEYGFYAYFTADATKDPSTGVLLDKHPELLSVDAKGARFIHRSFGDFYSLCPSNPKSHELLATLCAEVAARYPIDGLNLDRIRYAAADYCYCDYCKGAFKKDAGIELVPFEAGSGEALTWLVWKREQTAKAVATIARAVRAVRGERFPISSYVVGPDEMDDKAQGWDLWVKQGSVDAVAVSMYGADIEPAARKALTLLGGDGSRLLCALNAGIRTELFTSNIEIARRHAPRGQFLWHWGDVIDDLEPLARGPYQKPAAWPEP